MLRLGCCKHLVASLCCRRIRRLSSRRCSWPRIRCCGCRTTCAACRSLVATNQSEVLAHSGRLFIGQFGTCWTYVVVSVVAIVAVEMDAWRPDRDVPGSCGVELAHFGFPCLSVTESRTSRTTRHGSRMMVPSRSWRARNLPLRENLDRLVRPRASVWINTSSAFTVGSRIACAAQTHEDQTSHASQSDTRRQTTTLFFAPIGAGEASAWRA